MKGKYFYSAQVVILYHLFSYNSWSTHYCRNKAAIREDRSQDLTHIEYNAIWYTAGYVPRALKKKLVKSCHKNKKELLLCFDDLISCDGEDPGPSTE